MSHWTDGANCRGQYVSEFYPDLDGGGNGHVLGTIRALCTDCPVQQACRAASVPEIYGFWGGLTAAERISMRKRIKYITPALDADIARFHRAADRGYHEGNMHTALTRLLGEQRAAIVLGWRPGGVRPSSAA